jgi:biofilm regulator BssS
LSNRQHSNSALLKRWPTNYAINITRHTHNTCITTADHIGIREEVQKRNQVPERCVRHILNHFHAAISEPEFCAGLFIHARPVVSWLLSRTQEKIVMSKDNDIPVFPVAGWQAGPLPGYDAIALKLKFLSSPMQDVGSPQETQFFAITPEMAENLISDLQRHIEAVRSSGIHSPQGDKH